MEPISTITGTMLPLDRANVDTDQIIPKQFLKRIERSGYGEFLFYDWARTEDGDVDPDFVTNRPEYGGASVLVSGPNFGSGSSREHAVWALEDWGIKVVVAPSFADIFRANCARVGVVLVELPEDRIEALLRLAAEPPATATVDLPAQTISADGFEETFEIDPATKAALIEGLDTIGGTLRHGDAIDAYEQQRAAFLPSAG